MTACVCGAEVPPKRKKFCSQACAHRVARKGYKARQRESRPEREPRPKVEREPGERIRRPSGVYVYWPGHPIAPPSRPDILAEHRFVAYEARDGSSRCDVCGLDPGWPSVIVVQRDCVKSNVEPVNLLVACREPCGCLLQAFLHLSLFDVERWERSTEARAAVAGARELLASALEVLFEEGRK